MATFLYLIVIIAVIWYVFSLNKQKKAERAFNLFDEAEPWLVKHKINSESVYFGCYEEAGLAYNAGATVIAGTGKYINGEDVGFAIEVISGKGVLLSEFFEPYGIAGWHKSASMQAQSAGIPLIKVLKDMAKQHKENYSEE